MFILVRGNIVFSAFTGKCFRNVGQALALCWLQNMIQAMSQIFCYSKEHLKKKMIFFNPLSLTESEDGTAQRHDELPVLEHLGLGLELHGADHEDDDAGHEECHAEVEERQLTSETLVTVAVNRNDESA